MKARSILFSALLLPFAIFAFVKAARATPIVDQQQPIIDSRVGGMFIGGASEQKLAQVVTAGVTGTLTEVRLPVSCSSGDLRVEIQGVTGGEPNGTILAVEIVPRASLAGAPPNFRSLPFSDPVSLAAGSLFAIVLSSTGTCGVFQGPDGDPYSGGNGFYDSRPNPPGWVLLTERFDLPFQTVVEGNAFRSFHGRVSLNLGPRESDDTFVVSIVFEPGGDAQDLDPAALALSFQIGPFARIIAAGSFVDRRRGLHSFEGTVDGVRLRAALRIRPGRCYLRLEGSGASLEGTRIPIELNMSFGEQSGRALLMTLSAGEPGVGDRRRVRF